MNGKAVVTGGLTSLLWFSISISEATAAQADYGFGYIGESRSNIDQRPTNGSREWINSALAGIAYAENTADFVGHVVAQGEYRDYSRNTFADETLFFLDTSNVWTISPGRMTWTLADAFREVTLDPTQPTTPANRAGANVVETGPDFYLRFGVAHTFSLGVRYGNVYVGDSELDNSRYGFVGRWIYRFNPQIHYSLNAEYARVDFDNEVTNENFRRRDVYMRLQGRWTRSELTADAGATHFSRERSGDVSGPLVQLRWRQDLSALSTVGLSLSGSYQEIGRELLRYVTPTATTTDITLPPAPTIDVISNDLYYSKDADLFYSNRGSRVTWTSRLVARDIDFENPATQDRQEAGANVDVAYLHSSRTTVGLAGSVLNVEYENSTREDKEKQMWMRVGYRLQRNLFLGLDVGRVQRSSSDPAFNFVDDRAMLSILWSTGQLYSPLSRGRR